MSMLKETKIYFFLLFFNNQSVFKNTFFTHLFAHILSILLAATTTTTTTKKNGRWASIQKF